MVSCSFLLVRFFRIFLPLFIVLVCFEAEAQRSIPLRIDLKTGIRNVAGSMAADGSLQLQTKGNNPSVLVEGINKRYNHKKDYYLSFSYKTPAIVRGLKIYLNADSTLQPVETYALHPADSFTTAVFRLNESIDWKSGIKKFRLDLGHAAGKVLFIKDLQLRTPTKQELALEPIFIDNGTIRLGVDVSGGGSIFYFAQSATYRNLLNHADKGRYVQQSYYGVKDSSYWGKKPWVWNPVQGGGSSESGSSPARVLEKKVSATTIYIKSLPKHWATGVDIADATMEEIITLDKNIAHIRYTFRYNGTTVHPIRSQELPAVFVDYALANLVFYSGAKPWQKDTLSNVVPGWPNQPQTITENWAAYVDNNNWGIGVYVPGTAMMTTYRHTGDLLTGPYAGACSYFAPVRKFSITPGLVFTYDVYMTIDDVSNMRQRFYQIYSKQ